MRFHPALHAGKAAQSQHHDLERDGHYSHSSVRAQHVGKLGLGQNHFGFTRLESHLVHRHRTFSQIALQRILANIEMRHVIDADRLAQHRLDLVLDHP